MLTIKKDPNQSYDVSGDDFILSDEVYEIVELSSYLTSFKIGQQVRLISGIGPKKDSKTPGFHHSKGWVTVCPVEAKFPLWRGVKKEHIRLVNPRERKAKDLKPDDKVFVKGMFGRSIHFVESIVVEGTLAIIRFKGVRRRTAVPSDSYCELDI